MWLSGTFPAKGSVIQLNTTVDQIIAQNSRPGHDVPVDGVRDRGSLEPSRQLRRRFPLLVHEHDLLAHADAAAADGDQSARRVRADVRRRRAPRPKSGGRGWSRTPASSTRSARASTICSAASAPRDRAKLDRVHRQRARDRAADSAGREAAHRNAASRRRRPRSACRNLGRARQADVRADGAGLSGQPDARRRRS